MPSVVVNHNGQRLSISAADCKEMALRSRRDHMARVAENNAIMASPTLPHDDGLVALMVGLRRLYNKFATCWTLLHNRMRVAFDRAFDQLTDQCMTILEDTEACVQDEDSPMREGTYTIFVQCMKEDRDICSVFRDAMTELGAWNAE